jgi:hypothetical protein
MDIYVSSVSKDAPKTRFIGAIHARRKVRIKFFSKEDGTYITRVCAPMDYGPSKRALDFRNKFHVWGYESGDKPNPLALDGSHIEEISVLDETFNPAEFVTWDLKASPWIVKRDWGCSPDADGV